MTLKKIGPVEAPERCPQCGTKVNTKLVNNQLVLLNLDGKPHQCFDEKPIGKTVTGHVIDGFSLKGRRATFILDGGYELEVRALDYHPLFLRLLQPDGKVLEE